MQRPTISVATLALALAACSASSKSETSAPGGSLEGLMKARGLGEADVSAALMTYTPSGKHDEYYVFASGGHSGQVLVIGVPSMRILKVIGVFTPEPWQGYAYGDDATDKTMKSGRRHDHDITWADTHHPALSETKGDYDGQYLFIGDKANPRVAVIDLRDFATKQIVANPLFESSHGASFVTPNTEYIIEASQYPAPYGGTYADVSEFNDKYRGGATFWKFDREKGRIDPDSSFTIELPPYMQDLSDAGKLDSDGWAFFNSFDTERAWGGDQMGNPPLESGASKNDMDYLHVVNWRRAEEVVKAGKVTVVNGMKVITLPTAIEE